MSAGLSLSVQMSQPTGPPAEARAFHEPGQPGHLLATLHGDCGYLNHTLQHTSP